MTGAVFEVTFDDSAILGALDRLQEGIAAEGGLLAQIGAYGVASTTRRFGTETAPDGAPWKGLNPAYASFKGAGYDILTRSGALRSSQHYVVGAGEVSWGSGMIYAAVHQFGATIVPKNAKALSFQLGLDGRRVFAKSVTIPARPYLGISLEDREEIIAITQDFLGGLISGA
jgi:phage virion morphogenesis protein